jgi:hypothetical protein
MTNNPGIPTTAVLSTPYIIKTKAEFWEFAKGRVLYREQAQHTEFIKTVFRDNSNSSASFMLTGDRFDASPSLIYSYEISINLGSLPNDYMKLMNAIIEHEIYESWMYIKPGIYMDSSISKQSEAAHLLAKRHEYRILLQTDLLILRMKYDKFFGDKYKRDALNSFSAAIKYGNTQRYEYNKRYYK